jgi:hypothetical protein
MREYDRLPRELRRWVAGAIMPWRAGSVEVAYKKALKRTGSPQLALGELDRIQRSMVAKDARKVWGENHPFTNAASPNQA